jgi:hypothetical protein
MLRSPRHGIRLVDAARAATERAGELGRNACPAADVQWLTQRARHRPRLRRGTRPTPLRTHVPLRLFAHDGAGNRALVLRGEQLVAFTGPASNDGRLGFERTFKFEYSTMASIALLRAWCCAASQLSSFPAPRARSTAIAAAECAPEKRRRGALHACHRHRTRRPSDLRGYLTTRRFGRPLAAAWPAAYRPAACLVSAAARRWSALVAAQCHPAAPCPARSRGHRPPARR